MFYDYIYINNEIDKTLVGYDLSTLERRHVFNLIQNEIAGYGPITPLLRDTAITEIMVNAPNEIYVEIDGKIATLNETIKYLDRTCSNKKIWDNYIKSGRSSSFYESHRADLMIYESAAAFLKFTGKTDTCHRKTSESLS